MLTPWSTLSCVYIESVTCLGDSAQQLHIMISCKQSNHLKSPNADTTNEIALGLYFMFLRQYLVISLLLSLILWHRMVEVNDKLCYVWLLNTELFLRNFSCSWK